MIYKCKCGCGQQTEVRLDAMIFFALATGILIYFLVAAWTISEDSSKVGDRDLAIHVQAV